ncbi:MAG: hypothetical protein ACOCP8_00005 [archaeon]
MLKEAQEISNDCYNKSLKFLEKNKEKLDLIARRLIEKETMYEEELNSILAN